MSVASNVRSRGAPAAAECADACLIAQGVAGLSVGLVLINPAGKVSWLNRAAEHVLGSTAAQCVGQPVGRVLKDPQLAAFWQDAANSSGNHLASVSLGWPKPLELKVNATHCVDQDGTPIGRALLICDVTDECAVQVRLTQAMADRLSWLADASAPSAPLASLTHQEFRILRLVGQGLGNDGIAEAVGISSATVRSHLKNLYRKLALTSRAGAVSYAVRNHLA